MVISHPLDGVSHYLTNWSGVSLKGTRPFLRAAGLPDESEGKFPSLPNESEQREVKPPTCHACTVEGAWCLE